jgi:hypothetical protein
MNVKRLKAISKLGLLFGIPLSLVLGLFGSGVYCGAQNRHAILSFERDWLKLDVEVPDPPEPSPAEQPDGEPSGEKQPDAEPVEVPPAKPATTEPRSDSPPEPVRTPDDPAVVREPPASVPETRTDPLQGELADRFTVPITVQVKVLVAPELIDRQPAWIDYVQRTVSQANRVYQKQFGIELELVGVGRWPIATEGMSVAALRSDLESRSREGADILLGFTDEPLPGDPHAVEVSAFNLAHGVVGATSGAREHDAHLRSTLREVSRMFGARDIADADDPDWQAGSWMSDAPVSDAQAPWIDGANRRRILERKDKPFTPEE